MLGLKQSTFRPEEPSASRTSVVAVREFVTLVSDALRPGSRPQTRLGAGTSVFQWSVGWKGAEKINPRRMRTAACYEG
jgi:hypothetical protein